MSAVEAPPGRPLTAPRALPAPYGPAGARPSGAAADGPGRARGACAAPRASGASLLGMVGGFVRLYVEVEAGLRPRRQLRDLVTPEVYLRLADRVPGRDRPTAIVRMGGKLATPRRFEAVVLLEGTRVGVLAVALRRHSRGWLVDDVGRPEDRPRR